MAKRKSKAEKELEDAAAKEVQKRLEEKEAAKAMAAKLEKANQFADEFVNRCCRVSGTGQILGANERDVLISMLMDLLS